MFCSFIDHILRDLFTSLPIPQYSQYVYTHVPVGRYGILAEVLRDSFQLVHVNANVYIPLAQVAMVMTTMHASEVFASVKMEEKHH